MAKSAQAIPSITLRQRLEFGFIWSVVHGLRLLPRSMARSVGSGVGDALRLLHGKLAAVGRKNLEIAFPAMSQAARKSILCKTFRNLGRLLAEFCWMARYTREDAQKIMRYQGLQNFLEARDKGKGVLVLTGHLGAWELSSFLHSLMGYPMGMVIRRLDNPLVDRLVNRIRCLHGNRVLHKDDFARDLLRAMTAGDTVGILMDTNMTPPQGEFVPFFGVDACTASGLARVARKTDAAVVPGFLLWEEQEAKYVLYFGQELILQRTSDAEADHVANTAQFAQVTEEYIRRYPDQWLWLHRRWKTRPPGQPAIY